MGENWGGKNIHRATSQVQAKQRRMPSGEREKIDARRAMGKKRAVGKGGRGKRRKRGGTPEKN